MKVAVLYYGHMRTYEKTYESQLNYLLCEYQPDIFIHTWDEIEARTKSWHNSHMKVNPLDNKHRNKIQSYYSPVAIKIETQPQLNDNRTTPNNNISYVGQKFMLESLQKANELKIQHERKNNFEYDVVIKIRPDIMLKKPLIVTELNTDNVYVASNKRIRACDIINYSTSKNMDIISNVVDYFDQFFVDNVINGFSNHSGYIDYIQSQNLKLIFLDYLYNRDWQIIRSI